MYSIDVYTAVKNFFTANFQSELTAYETAKSLAPGTIRPLTWIDYINKMNENYPYMLITERLGEYSPENFTSTKKTYQFSVLFEYEGGDPATIARDLLIYRDAIVSLIERFPTFGDTVGSVTQRGVSPAITGEKASGVYGGTVVINFDVTVYTKIR